MEQKFWDRGEAGRQLGDQIIRYLDNQRIRERGVVVGLARGGVVVADEVAKALGWPMEVLVVRKIGALNNPEYGVGAIAEGGTIVYDDEALANLNLEREDLAQIVQKETKELYRRIEEYRGGRELGDLEGKMVVIVDDGLATGITMRAAIEAVRKLQLKKQKTRLLRLRRMADPRNDIIVGVPVGAKETIQDLDGYVVCVREVEYLGAIGSFYENFEQVTDEEVKKILSQR